MRRMFGTVHACFSFAALSLSLFCCCRENLGLLYCISARNREKGCISLITPPTNNQPQPPNDDPHFYLYITTTPFLQNRWNRLRRWESAHPEPEFNHYTLHTLYILSTNTNTDSDSKGKRTYEKNIEIKNELKSIYITSPHHYHKHHHHQPSSSTSS
jgi:hypothetical protein